MEALSRMSIKEVKHVLKGIAWRGVREWLRKEARGCPKLELMRKLIANCVCKMTCDDIGCKIRRRISMKLKGGMAELRIELTGGMGCIGMSSLVGTVMEKWKMLGTFCCTALA